MGADDNLLLAAVLHHLDDGGHLGDLLCDLRRGGLLQDKARTSGTVCRTDDVFRADSLADVRGELGIVTTFS